MDCQICFEKCEPNVAIVCLHCEQMFCRTCCKRYILEETISPRCPGCFKPWTRHVLYEHFGKAFLAKEYKTKRERDVLETEKALLPQTLQRMKELDESHNVTIIQRDVSTIRSLMQSTITRAEKITAASDLVIILSNCLQVLDTSIDLSIYDNKRVNETIKCFNVTKTGPCRGYMSKENGSYVCQLCKFSACDKCRVEKRDDHVCDPDVVATVRFLKTDTKSCPKCSVPIHKIDGCDQMYCVACHTAFSWKTLEIVIGRIHNPHYYEYMRQNGELPRENGDEECGGLPAARHQSLLKFHRTLAHVHDVELMTVEPGPFDERNPNFKLRVLYLRGQLSESDFATRVQRKDKLECKKKCVREIMATMYAVGCDILRNDQPIETTRTAIRNLQTFTIDALNKVAKVYGMSVDHQIQLVSGYM